MEKIPSIDMGEIRNTVYDYTDGELKHVHDGKARVVGLIFPKLSQIIEVYFLFASRKPFGNLQESETAPLPPVSEIYPLLIVTVPSPFGL